MNEKKPGVKTTEFWLALFASVYVAVAATGISNTTAAIISAGSLTLIVCAYILSRGISKGGGK